jgi:hypothetical protein
MTTNEQIFIQVGDDIIELTGKAKEDFIADREAINIANQAAKAEEATNAALKAEQKAGLLERLGITAEEAELLLS